MCCCRASRMVRAGVSTGLRSGKQIAATMYGNTTPAVMRAKQVIEQRGRRARGLRSQWDGRQGDGRPHRPRPVRCGARLHHARAHRRALWADSTLPARTAWRQPDGEGSPSWWSPGCVDFLIREAKGHLTGKYRGRKSYHFNPVLSLVRRRRWSRAGGSGDGREAQPGEGPTTVLIPQLGFSMYARPGGPLHDPKGDRAFISSLKRHLAPHVRILEERAWMNDRRFADRAANCSSRCSKHMVSKRALPSHELVTKRGER